MGGHIPSGQSIGTAIQAPGTRYQIGRKVDGKPVGAACGEAGRDRRTTHHHRITTTHDGNRITDAVEGNVTRIGDLCEAVLGGR